MISQLRCIQMGAFLSQFIIPSFQVKALDVVHGRSVSFKADFAILIFARSMNELTTGLISYKT